MRSDFELTWIYAMANVDLWFKGMGYAVYDLPPVCMKCGANATVVEKRRFGRTNGKGATVEMPFCSRHVSHFDVQHLISVAFKVAVPICVVGIVGSGLGALTAKGSAWFFSVWLLLLSLSIVPGLYWSLRSGPRLKSVTEKRIQFSNVSPKFVQALVEAEAKWLERLDCLDRELGDHWHDRDCQKSEEERRYQCGHRETPPQVTDSSDSEQDQADV
jgi:hypothetical protein